MERGLIRKKETIQRNNKTANVLITAGPPEAEKVNSERSISYKNGVEQIKNLSLKAFTNDK